MFLASLGKNSITTFQHIVIQVFWEKTRLLRLLMALFSGFKKSEKPMMGDFGQSQVISERERSYWLFIQRRQLSITHELRSNGQTRKRWSNMNQYSVSVMHISHLRCFQKHLVVYCLAVKLESLLRLVGGAWYFLNWSQHGCRVTNFLILQLNSTLQDVSENIWGEK